MFVIAMTIFQCLEGGRLGTLTKYQDSWEMACLVGPEDILRCHPACNLMW